MSPYLSPEWLAIEEQMGGRPLLSGSFENYQKNAKMIEAYIVAHLPPRAEDGMKDRPINSHVTVRIYIPAGTTGPLPIGIFCHEGGFCEGSLETSDALCRIVAAQLPCIVVSVDYRKAPKVPIHTVFQDALDAFIWTYDEAASLGGDQSKIFMWGCSAGGSLSLGTAHKLIELGRKGQLKGVANLAGGTVHEGNVPKEYQHLYRSMEENKENVPIIDREATHIINSVTGLNDFKDDPWLYPVHSQHLADFPSTYLVSCGADPFRDDNVVLEAALKKNGVPVELEVYKGLPHVFWIFPTMKSSKVFLENLLKGIRTILK